MRLKICLLTLLFSVSTSALACPLVSSLVDLNCNQRLKFSFVGDSIVSGVGDGSFNPHGYPSRLKEALKETARIRIKGVGFPGITSWRLLSQYTGEYSRKRRHRTRSVTTPLINSDLIVVDVGRNDYWSGVSPAITANNIKRLVKLIRRNNKKNGIAPLVIAATLLPTNRGFQAPFIDSVNSLLLAQSSRRFPVLVRFDTMPRRLLLDDGLHPGSDGYNWMALYLKGFILDEMQTLMADRHSDIDADGVYDLLEERYFGTDSEANDTDGDTYLDGQELFELFTDPLDPTDPPAELEATPSPTESASPSPLETPSPSESPSASPSESPSPSETPSESPSPSPSPSPPGP